MLPQYFPKDRSLFLDVILVGTAATLTDCVLQRLIQLLDADYSATVKGVTMIGLHDEQAIPPGDIRPASQLPLSIVSFDDLSRQLEGRGPRLRLRFRTPLKLVKDGRPLRQAGAADILRALCRRVSSLAYHYCCHEFDVDYRQLSELAGGISLDNRVINGQHTSAQGNSGLSGNYVLRGDLAPFYPFLAAGAVCHVGKGACSGYGCYDILADD
jgi:hypothetical protein